MDQIQFLVQLPLLEEVEVVIMVDPTPYKPEDQEVQDLVVATLLAQPEVQEINLL